MCIPEIDLKLESKKINTYHIEDIVKMFGKRIEKAIVYEDSKPYGLDIKKLNKICKRWKFWNRDIKKAYKNYQGIIYVPWIIINRPPIIIDGNFNSEKYNFNIP